MLVEVTQISFTPTRKGRCEPGPLRPSQSGVRLTLLFPPRDDPPPQLFAPRNRGSHSPYYSILPVFGMMPLLSVSRMPDSPLFSPAASFPARIIYIRSSAPGVWTKSSSARLTVYNHVSSHFSPPTCTLHLGHRHRHHGSCQGPSNRRPWLWCVPRLLLQRTSPPPSSAYPHTNTTTRRATTPTSSRTSASPRPRSANCASALLSRR